MACKVPRCKNVNRLNNPESGITFHRFPKGDRFELFKEIIGVPNLQWGPRKYICSDHFLDTDFYPGGKRILKKIVVPSRNLVHMEACEGSSDTFCPFKRKDDLALNENYIKMLRTSVTSLPHQKKETFREPVVTESSDTLSASTSSSTIQNTVALVRFLHNYSLSPGKERKKSVEAKEKCKKLVNALYKSRKKVQQLEKKITYLQKIADELKAKEITSVTCLDQL